MRSRGRYKEFSIKNIKIWESVNCVGIDAWKDDIASDKKLPANELFTAWRIAKVLTNKRDAIWWHGLYLGNLARAQQTIYFIEYFWERDRLQRLCYK